MCIIETIRQSLYCCLSWRPLQHPLSTPQYLSLLLLRERIFAGLQKRPMLHFIWASRLLSPQFSNFLEIHFPILWSKEMNCLILFVSFGGLVSPVHAMVQHEQVSLYLSGLSTSGFQVQHNWKSVFLRISLLKKKNIWNFTFSPTQCYRLLWQTGINVDIYKAQQLGELNEKVVYILGNKTQQPYTPIPNIW